MDRQTATGRETVASFAARWPADYPRPRASTNLHNAERVKPFAQVHERRRMDSITVEEARTWAVRHTGQLLALRAMFNDARRSGIVVSNPFRELGIERSRGPTVPRGCEVTSRPMIKRPTFLILACTMGLALALTIPGAAAAATAVPGKWQDQLRKLNEKQAGGKLSSRCVPESAISAKMRVAYRVLGRSRGCVPRALEPRPGGVSSIAAWSYKTKLRGLNWCLVNTLTPAAPVQAVVGLALAMRHCGKHAWHWVTWPGDRR